MLSDPFALLRKRDRGQSTSFEDGLEHLEHGVLEPVFSGEPQKTAIAHPEHPVHCLTAGPGAGGLTRRDLAHLPDHWRAAMRSMAGSRAPQGATPDRWRAITRDAGWFLLSWHDRADELGWSVEDVFGYDPEEAPGAIGLAVALRGDRVADLFVDRRGRHFAHILTSAGARMHQRSMPQGTRPIWALEARSMQQ